MVEEQRSLGATKGGSEECEGGLKGGDRGSAIETGRRTYKREEGKWNGRSCLLNVSARHFKSASPPFAGRPHQL
eukprot:3072274-Rhodomonas_salina.1